MVFLKKKKNISFHLGVAADEEISRPDRPSKVTSALPFGSGGPMLSRGRLLQLASFLHCEMLIVCTWMRYNV